MNSHLSHDYNFRAWHSTLPTMLASALASLWGLPQVQGAVVVLLSGLLSLLLSWLHSRKLRLDVDAAKSAEELRKLSEPPKPNGFAAVGAMIAALALVVAFLGLALLALVVDGCSGQRPGVVYHPESDAVRAVLVGARIGGCLVCEHVTPQGDVVDGLDAGTDAEAGHE